MIESIEVKNVRKFTLLWGSDQLRQTKIVLSRNFRPSQSLRFDAEPTNESVKPGII